VQFSCARFAPIFEPAIVVSESKFWIGADRAGCNRRALPHDCPLLSFAMPREICRPAQAPLGPGLARAGGFEWLDLILIKNRIDQD